MVSAHTLPEETFLSRLRLGKTPVTKEVLLAHYGRRVMRAWLRPPEWIRDPPVQMARLSAEDLVALADSFLEHRLVVSMHRPNVTPDGRIAWDHSPALDPEWLWALNRHQWWCVWGLAYTQTRDERYAAAFVDQMLDWVAKNPSPDRRNEQSPSWRLMEVGMRMRISWIPCFALFYGSPTFTDEAKLTMLRSIYDHARFLYLFKSSNNHLLRESNGLLYVGTFFPEFREARLWRQEALHRLDQALVKQVNQDGSHFEVSTGYQSLVITEFQNTYELLVTSGLSLPREDLASWLVKMYRIMAYVARPDGTFPYVNDGYVYWQSSQLATAGRMLESDDLVYVGTGGQQGVPPESTSIALADAGLYVMRSDWAKEARYLLFDSGPYGGYHGHEDKLSVEVHAFGQAFVVDPGCHSYDLADPFRSFFVSSLAHNTVLVDGKSQIRRWYKENMRPRVGLSNDTTWVSRPGFDYVSACYCDGYSSFSFRKPRDAEIITDVVHTRRILFVKPDYWIIFDEIQAGTLHSYQVLFHTVPDVVAQVRPGKRVTLGTVPHTATLHLVPADPSDIEVSWLSGSEDPIQGWYSSEAGYRTPSAVVIFERKCSASTVITTLLYPCRNGQSDEAPAIQRLAVSGGQGEAYVVTTRRGRDYLAFSCDGSLKRFGPYQSRGTIAGIRTASDGTVLSQFEWNAS